VLNEEEEEMRERKEKKRKKSSVISKACSHYSIPKRQLIEKCGHVSMVAPPE